MNLSIYLLSFPARIAVTSFILASAFTASALAYEAAPPSSDHGAGAKPLPPGGGPNGEEVFNRNCVSCHSANATAAPTKRKLGEHWPDAIVSGFAETKNAAHTAKLTTDEVDAVATYLSGRRPSNPISLQYNSAACESNQHFSMSGPSWNGWSADAQNLRYQPKPGFKAKDVSRLKVKWAFTYVGSRYGQPSVVGGRVFTSSSSGKIYSLDAKTGCTYWRFDAPAGVRTSLNIAKNSAAPSGYAAYFGSSDKVFYAVDAATGVKLWETRIANHPREILTGAPVMYKDRILQPISSSEETGTTGENYPCCSARGALVALNMKTGAIMWKTYMIPEAKPFAKNRLGFDMTGPAGAAIWSAPTVDAKRKLVYVTTGDSYVDVPEEGSDSVVAMDLDTGAIKWKHQLTQGDIYLAGCPRERKPNSQPNCPEKNSDDSDFGASAFLIKGPKHKQVLVAGQKSSNVYALNPDNGELVWQTKLGKGSALGGIEWGMTTDGKQIYAANADIAGGKPGLHALDPVTGKTVWFTHSPKVRCAWQGTGAVTGTLCINSNSQAPSAIPGAVFSGTIDGHMRAYDSKTGEIVWDFDTAAAKYDTVNGVKDQPGGSLDAAGPTIVGGMMYLMSGYNGTLGGVSNNVLLAFSIDGK